jgi:hypothetical protein
VLDKKIIFTYNYLEITFQYAGTAAEESSFPDKERREFQWPLIW